MTAAGRRIVLLRGINLGPRNRIAMSALREAMAEHGFEDVRTYLQSGNIVLSTGMAPEQLVRDCERIIAKRFGVDVDVVVRTREELAAVVECDPLGHLAVNPKRYQVSFLAQEPAPDAVEKVTALAAEPERLMIIGREAYAWHPDGIGRSKLSAALAGPLLGVTATARNWTTVTRLLSMAEE